MRPVRYIETSEQLREERAKIETEFRDLFNTLADKYGDKVGTIDAPKFDDNISTEDAEQLATLNLVRIRARLALETQHTTEKEFNAIAKKYNIDTDNIPSGTVTAQEYEILSKSFSERTDAFTRLNKVRLYTGDLPGKKA